MVFGFFIDVTVLSIAFILTIVFRRSIAKLIMRIPLPVFAVYLISSLPFIIFEEFINCIECFPDTIIWLLSFVLILGIVVKKTSAKRIVPITVIFSILGVLFEVFFGKSSGGISTLQVPMLIFMLFWIGLSYAFLVIVPLTIIVENSK